MSTPKTADGLFKDIDPDNIWGTKVYKGNCGVDWVLLQLNDGKFSVQTSGQVHL